MNRTMLSFALMVLPFVLWAQQDPTTANPSENDFFGADAPTVADNKASTVDPTTQFNEAAERIRWGGTLKSDATWQPGFVGGYPGESSATWKDGVAYDLLTTVFLDSRPDKDFRFRLSLQTGYPFTNSTAVAAPYPNPANSNTTVVQPNIKVWEMFTDVTIENTVFLRFGKQSASWGVSYFYSPGDVISLTAKDATDPTAQREGPLALKATVPFPNQKANLTAFVLARDSYLGNDQPTLGNLGYALQGDILYGDAQFTLGGFYQKDNAPKAVATVNTGLGFTHMAVLSDINVFSEAVFSSGADVLKGSGQGAASFNGTTYATYTQLSNWDKNLYYTGTFGASYTNTDANLTLRSEYLFNPFGSNDKNAAAKAYGTFRTLGLFVPTNTTGRVYGYSDAAIPGMHNMTSLLSLTKLGGVDRLSFSTFWQHNISDGSGWVKPMFSLDPWDQLTFSWGVGFVYGDNDTQYPLQFQYLDKQGNSSGTQRATLYLGVSFGTGKY